MIKSYNNKNCSDCTIFFKSSIFANRIRLGTWATISINFSNFLYLPTVLHGVSFPVVQYCGESVSPLYNTAGSQFPIVQYCRESVSLLFNMVGSQFPCWPIPGSQFPRCSIMRGVSFPVVQYFGELVSPLSNNEVSQFPCCPIMWGVGFPVVQLCRVSVFPLSNNAGS